MNKNLIIFGVEMVTDDICVNYASAIISDDEIPPNM